MRRLPSTAKVQARRQRGPCPVELSGLEKPPEGQHALAAIASPALPGAFHPGRHQNLVGGSSGDGGDASKTPVNQVLESILGIAVQLLALTSLGNELGLSKGGAFEDVERVSDDKEKK